MENLSSLLLQKQISNKCSVNTQIFRALEESFVKKDWKPADCLESTDSVISTISIAISPDGQTFASSHGDHTVKVFKFESKELIRVFQGHPRTPWSVKYNPVDANILASGCLGFEVRIWNIRRNLCVNCVTFANSIISLAFHPLGDLVVVSSGTQLHVWDWREGMPIVFGGYPRSQSPYPHRRTVTHERNIRAVCFLPSGEFLLAAAPDPPREEPTASFTPCR